MSRQFLVRICALHNNAFVKNAAVHRYSGIFNKTRYATILYLLFHVSVPKNSDLLGNKQYSVECVLMKMIFFSRLIKSNWYNTHFIFFVNNFLC